MSGFGIFDIAGSALAAQSVRLNTVASNLANAESVSGDPAAVFRPKEPVFEATPVGEGATLPGVRVREVAENTAEPLKRYEPGHPLADGEGYVYDHDTEQGVALEQTGFPEALGERVYYRPVARGLELKLKDKLDALRAARAGVQGE